MKIKFGSGLVAGMVGIALHGAALADTLNFNTASGGNTTGYFLFSDTSLGTTLSTKLKFELTSLTATTAVFDVDVFNNSSIIAGAPKANGLMSFSVTTVSPALSGASANNTGSTLAGVDWSASTGDNMAGGFNPVAVCLYAANQCSGGSIDDALDAGASDSLILTLMTSGDFTTDGISFTSPYGVKFQSIGGSGGPSLEFAGCASLNGTTCGTGGGGSGGGGSGGGPGVPEPGSLALVGLALLGVGAARKRLS